MRWLLVLLCSWKNGGTKKYIMDLDPDDLVPVLKGHNHYADFLPM
jgi:hypothetical protein